MVRLHQEENIIRENFINFNLAHKKCTLKFGTRAQYAVQKSQKRWYIVGVSQNVQNVAKLRAYILSRSHLSSKHEI